MQLLDMPEPPHSLVYYFALLADLCSVERIQPSVRLCVVVVSTPRWLTLLRCPL